MTYELRTYTATPGRLGALVDRFRQHTVALFAEHGMVSVGYWTRADDSEVLVYLLQHVGDAKANWAEFHDDPRWVRAKAASESDGPLTTAITSVFLEATDFSAIGGAAAD